MHWTLQAAWGLNRKFLEDLPSTLPEDAVPKIVGLGWPEPHPMAAAGVFPPTAVMVHAPRNAAEIETVLGLLGLSYDFARGRLGRVDNVVP